MHVNRDNLNHEEEFESKSRAAQEHRCTDFLSLIRIKNGLFFFIHLFNENIYKQQNTENKDVSELLFRE